MAEAEWRRRAGGSPTTNQLPPKEVLCEPTNNYEPGGLLLLLLQRVAAGTGSHGDVSAHFTALARGRIGRGRALALAVLQRGG